MLADLDRRLGKLGGGGGGGKGGAGTGRGGGIGGCGGGESAVSPAGPGRGIAMWPWYSHADEQCRAQQREWHLAEAALEQPAAWHDNTAEVPAMGAIGTKGDSC